MMIIHRGNGDHLVPPGLECKRVKSRTCPRAICSIPKHKVSKLTHGVRNPKKGRQNEFAGALSETPARVGFPEFPLD